VRCFIRDKEVKLIPAQVKLYKDKVYLNVSCDSDKHKAKDEMMMICSDVEYFIRLLNQAKSKKLHDIADIEELDAVLSTSKDPPLVIEVDAFEQENLVSEEEILKRLKAATKISKDSHHHIFKINGGPLRTKSGLVSFNKLLFSLEKKFPRGPILVELPFDRLIDVCLLEDSALVKGRLYPCVRYFLKHGEENMFVEEMNQLVQALNVFKDIQLTMVISLDMPYASLKEVFEFLVSHNKLIRCIIISPQRSLQTILSNAMNDSSEEVISSDVDLMRIFQEITKASQGKLQAKDFFPLSYIELVEPLLLKYGYGKFKIRASPFCALMSVIVNHQPANLNFVPLSHLVNIDGFFKDANRILEQKDPEDSAISLWQAHQIQNTLEKNMLKKQFTPSLSSFFTSRESEMERWTRSLQFVIIHNNMDLASFDLNRRCQCCDVKSSILDPNRSSSVCTGCI
jgi:hypothetical protein